MSLCMACGLYHSEYSELNELCLHTESYAYGHIMAALEPPKRPMHSQPEDIHPRSLPTWIPEIPSAARRIIGSGLSELGLDAG
jgi:hypothetical protein